MKELTRDEAKEAIIEAIIDGFDWSTVYDIVRHGFVGVDEQTDEELIEDWEFYFEESIKIKD